MGSSYSGGSCHTQVASFLRQINDPSLARLGFHARLGDCGKMATFAEWAYSHELSDFGPSCVYALGKVPS